ncbi:MAG: Xaa-Pro peptidase family protein [Desulfobacteraceae bacterium]|jgi:Xaa-Pro aminopeptidase|nr:Xaa-Pro peptidase family protein [Desulfobacteraceae bacterium]
MKIGNHFKVPASEIESRTRKFQKKLQSSDMDGLFIVQRVDLFYFSGTAQNGFMYIPADGAPLLFIKQYLPRAKEESSVDSILEINSIKEIPELIIDHCGKLPATIGFELDVIPVNDFTFYQKLFPDSKCVDGSPLILQMRSIKSEWEITQMENTAEMSRKTFEYMQSSIKPGISEMEFAGMFETYARKLGHSADLRVRHYQTEGYPWHVLSGKNGGMVGLLDSPASGTGTSAAFPVGAGSKKLCANEPIMVDLGSVLNGYHMDETRMFAIDSMPKRAMDASRVAIEIHDSVIEKARPGITVGELFEHSVQLARSSGYESLYLGTPGHKVSFIGHGIGLELIEPYILAKNRNHQLEAGMTFALEPKMVSENEFSAGVESVFLVTESGSRLISKVPVEIFIC